MYVDGNNLKTEAIGLVIGGDFDNLSFSHTS